MAAADALVGEGLSISPWKEALAERNALLEVLRELVEASEERYLPFTQLIHMRRYDAAEQAARVVLDIVGKNDNLFHK